MLYRVPKRNLVGVTQVALQTSRLKIAVSLPEAAMLTSELQNFELRPLSRPAKLILPGGRTKMMISFLPWRSPYGLGVDAPGSASCIGIADPKSRRQFMPLPQVPAR